LQAIVFLLTNRLRRRSLLIVSHTLNFSVLKAVLNNMAATMQLTKIESKVKKPWPIHTSKIGQVTHLFILVVLLPGKCDVKR
jgi:hypothetical protein